MFLLAEGIPRVNTNYYYLLAESIPRVNTNYYNLLAEGIPRVNTNYYYFYYYWFCRLSKHPVKSKTMLFLRIDIHIMQSCYRVPS